MVDLAAHTVIPRIQANVMDFMFLPPPSVCGPGEPRGRFSRTMGESERGYNRAGRKLLLTCLKIKLNREKLGRILEARVGIEPTHKGFADLSLTTWVPRLNL